jgi:hypothetical protein
MYTFSQLIQALCVNLDVEFDAEGRCLADAGNTLL